MSRRLGFHKYNTCSHQDLGQFYRGAQIIDVQDPNVLYDIQERLDELLIYEALEIAQSNQAQQRAALQGDSKTAENSEGKMNLTTQL